jgi:hypothetical protein
MIGLHLNYTPSSGDNWLTDAKDALITGNKSGKLNQIGTTRQVNELFTLALSFNVALSNCCNIYAVQHYIRSLGDDCYDLLTVLPKEIFFSPETNKKLADYTREFKYKARSFGSQVGFISIPWTERIEQLKLDEDGYILIYNSIKAAA